MKVYIVKQCYELDGKDHEDCIRVFLSEPSAIRFISVQKMMDKDDEEHGYENLDARYSIEVCEMVD